MVKHGKGKALFLINCLTDLNLYVILYINYQLSAVGLKRRMKVMTFGKYLQSQRLACGKSMREFSVSVGITPQYLSDIENGKRAAPENEVLDKIIRALNLSVEEERVLYDIVAKERNSLAQDIPNYIKENEIIIKALRTAKDANAGVEEWQKFIDEMKQKNNGK